MKVVVVSWNDHTFRYCCSFRSRVCVYKYFIKICVYWHTPTNARTPVGHDLNNVCVSCKQEARRTMTNAERAILVSDEEKDARRNPTSKYPMSKLSPCSQNIKIERLKKERQGFQQKLKELVDDTSECTISTSTELAYHVIITINMYYYHCC